MQQFQRERQSTAIKSAIAGIILTLAVHVGALCLVSFNGLKYLYPPPAETSFLMEVEALPEEEEPQIKQRGREPASENVDKDAPVELVKKSESPYQGAKANKTPATRENGHGDVEVPEVKREKEPELDPRATFPGMARKDTSTTAPHSALASSEKSSDGQPDGNTTTGKVEGNANAHLEGRTVLGMLQKPVYAVQESGTVVVSILVDQYGKVTSATPGARGTTVNNQKLWNAARDAAMRTKFTMKADAPAEQKGTITYKFNLK